MVLAIHALALGIQALLIGDLDLSDSWLARRHAVQSFDSRSWQSGDAIVRGGMLSNLAATHRFVGMQGSAVRELLGPTQCYANYDDEPCYDLEYESARYRLVFSVDHSYQPGQIRSVDVLN